MIPQPFIHDLLDRVDIVDTIDRYVPLKKAGANFIACCPFHNEKTPSFTVSQTKQFYHCFGCGAHGNAITFLINYSGLSFVEAVHELAAHAGMQVPKQLTEVASKQASAKDHVAPTDDADHAHYSEIPKQEFLSVLKTATQYYREQLKVSEKAIDYLKKRGLSGKTAAHFGIGYAPPGWRNLEAAFPDYQSETTRDVLVKAGLVVNSEEGKLYDRFRNRIMFPILSLKGQIIGFGGRVLEQGEPKYMNSPETSLFEKGRELYNFFSARRAIREANCVVVVEGYMDVIALWQHGIEYAVAALGTATTAFHIQKLLRQTDQVVFCFDGDKAGRKAAWRALENSLSFILDGKYLSFLFLPEGDDPDSYVREHGKISFERQLSQAMPLSEFLFRELCAGINLQTDEGRAKLVHDAKPLLRQVKASVLSLMLINRLAELSGMSRNELEVVLEIKRIGKTQAVKNIPKKQPPSPYRWIILTLLHNPSYVTKLDRNLLVSSDGNTHEIDALKALVDFLEKHPQLLENKSSALLLTYLHDSPSIALLENIQSETLGWDDAIDIDAEFVGALERLEQMQRKKRMTELHNRPLGELTEEEKQELQRLAML